MDCKINKERILICNHYTNSTALIQPSSSGLFVTCAVPHTTFPDVVTKPRSLTFSITVPFVNTPSCVYMVDCGFFCTKNIQIKRVQLWMRHVALF